MKRITCNHPVGWLHDIIITHNDFVEFIHLNLSESGEPIVHYRYI